MSKDAMNFLTSGQYDFGSMSMDEIVQLRQRMAKSKSGSIKESSTRECSEIRRRRAIW